MNALKYDANKNGPCCNGMGVGRANGWGADVGVGRGWDDGSRGWGNCST